MYCPNFAKLPTSHDLADALPLRVKANHERFGDEQPCVLLSLGDPTCLIRV